MKQVVEMRLSKLRSNTQREAIDEGMKLTVHLAHISRGLVGDSSRVTSHFATRMLAW
ncbi:hypothetical protein RHMOL_Rhmol10G0033000 [Rhododendron molle]|uniref:Uncharacterized protein n=1 Tax=Rhododendron molle TaxID=49168 RepID=A0ACC0LYC4_RHOML|nr:hypothetical protein RHMOL_Rhmol10G0033000 [Rhododendron molle]